MTDSNRTSAPTTAPTYLVRTPYSYCFRYRIPPDLQIVVGRTEIRYSLKTGYIGKAKAMALQIAGRIQRLCADLRDIIRNQRGSIVIRMPDELSPERIQELIAGWVRETLKEDEQERFRPTKKLDDDTVTDKYNGFDWVRKQHSWQIANSLFDDTRTRKEKNGYQPGLLAGKFKNEQALEKGYRHLAKMAGITPEEAAEKAAEHGMEQAYRLLHSGIGRVG